MNIAVFVVEILIKRKKLPGILVGEKIFLLMICYSLNNIVKALRYEFIALSICCFDW